MSVSKRANGKDAEMAGIFNVKITGLDGIRKDVYRVKKSLKQPVEKGLLAMGEVMSTSLQKHIHDDWLADPWKPSEYIRRTGSPYEGSLGDPDSMQSTVQNSSLLFDYSPKTDHFMDDNWDDHDPNLMIYRIENNDAWKFQPHDYTNPYTGEEVPIKPRPFWHNFLDEMKGSNTLAYAFRAGFGNVENVQLKFEGGSKDIEWASGESEITSNDIGEAAFSTFGRNLPQVDAFGNIVEDYFSGGWDGDELDF